MIPQRSIKNYKSIRAWILIIGLGGMLFFRPVQGQERFDFFRADTQLHLWASFSISTIITQLLKHKCIQGYCLKPLEAMVYGTLATLFIGLFKELADGQISTSDLIGNTIGIGLSGVVCLFF